MNKKLFAKVMSSLLAIVMVTGMIPMTSFANTLDTQEGNLALGGAVTAMLPVPASKNGAPTPLDPQPADVVNVTDGIYDTHCFADAQLFAHKYQIVLPGAEANAGVKVNKMLLTFNSHISGDNALDEVVVKVTNDYVTWTEVGRFNKVDVSTQNTLEIVLDNPQDVWAVWVEGWDPVDETGTAMFMAEFEAYFDPSLIKPDTQEGNLALGGTVTAMLPVPASPNGDPTPIDPQPADVANVTDGVYDTHCYADAQLFAHKYQIVLPNADQNAGVKVNKMLLTFNPHVCGDNALDEVVVKVTNDYVTWTEVGRFNKVDVSTQNTLEIVLDNPQDVWVVWVEGWDPVDDTGTAMFMAEFEAYFDPSLIVPDTKEGNLALGGTVTAMQPASAGGYVIEPQPADVAKVTDGSYATYCYAGDGFFAHRYQIVLPNTDMNAGAKVNQLKVTLAPDTVNGDGKISYLTVKVSKDCSTWTTVGTYTDVDVRERNTITINMDTPQDVWVVWVEAEETVDDNGSAMFMAEFEAYYDASLIKLDTQEGNLALGGTVAAMLPVPASPDGAPTLIDPQPSSVVNVTDGIYDTHCYADAQLFAHKYQIALPGTDQYAGVPVNKMLLTFNPHICGDNALDEIVVKVTNDYDTWITVGEFTKVDVSKQNTLEIVLDKPEDVWVVWIEGWDPTDDTGTAMFMAEFEAYYDPALVKPDATAPVVTLSGAATVDGWNVTEWTDDANTVKVNVADAEGFTSTVTVNGETYVSGSDITLTEEGTIEVVVTTTADGYVAVTNTYTITVPAKTELAPAKIESSVYTIADGFIRKIDVGTTIGKFLSNVTPTGGSVKVFKTATATTALRDTVTVGTGMIVKLFDSNNNVVDTLTIVIMGDLSGDGKITTADLTPMKGNINGSRDLTDAQMQAANLAQPAKLLINTADLTFLKGALSGTRTITQR